MGAARRGRPQRLAGTRIPVRMGGGSHVEAPLRMERTLPDGRYVSMEGWAIFQTVVIEGEA